MNDQERKMVYAAGYRSGFRIALGILLIGSFWCLGLVLFNLFSFVIVFGLIVMILMIAATFGINAIAERLAKQ